MPFVSVNPATGDEIARYEGHTSAEVDRRLGAAAAGFRTWRAMSFAERGRCLITAAELLEGEVPVVGALLTAEMGKTFAAAKGEAAKCALALRYFAEHGEALLAEESIPTAARKSGVRYEPLGPVLAIMPWNFPLWQAIRFAAPALMAGNTGVLKHAENVGGAAAYLEGLFQRAGCPEGVFTNLFIEVDRVESVIADPRIAAVTLTGSARAGRAVAAAAGHHLKKSVLELGGSDAFIVLASADVDRAVELAVAARLQNNGQSCIAAKRFIAVDAVHDRFLSAFTDAMAAAPMGDPMDPATALGPIVSERQRAGLAEQVADGVARGATVRTGGTVPSGPGWYYPATVLTGVPDDSRAGHEELFGPVAVVHRAADLQAAVARANDSTFGLGATVMATDEAELAFATERLEVGMVFGNAMVASTPELPFGGIKESGFGRELSAVGIREFTNVKTFFWA